ncbi:unnamed protein product [Malus baccata var. baccata]
MGIKIMRIFGRLGSRRWNWLVAAFRCLTFCRQNYETQNKAFKKKKFSEAFKDLVGSCLNQDQGKRSMTERLLRNSFFINYRGGDSLMINVLLGLPSVEERFKRKMKMMKRSW